MKAWKTAVGVGAACAACCAIPLVGGAAALGAGSATLAAVGAAVMACSDELLPLAMALLGLATLGLGMLWWRRRGQRLAATNAATPTACSLDPKGCGCGPGSCR